MNVMLVLAWILLRNFWNSHPTTYVHIIPRLWRWQRRSLDLLSYLNLHFHPILDTLYITGACRFRLYIFFHCDFAIPLFSPLFDPTAPFLVVLIYMAHLIAPLVAPPASPPAPRCSHISIREWPLGGDGLILALYFTLRLWWWIRPGRSGHSE